MASRIAWVGRVTVSDRRSMRRMAGRDPTTATDGTQVSRGAFRRAPGAFPDRRGSPMISVHDRRRCPMRFHAYVLAAAMAAPILTPSAAMAQKPVHDES